MIGVLSFAFSYIIVNNNKIRLTFDNQNEITIPTKNLSYEDDNLLELLFWGTKYGVDFIFGNENNDKTLRDKTIKIYENNDKKIVQVSNGIKFYLDSIHPGNSIVETFVRKIHMVKYEDDFTDKIVVDIGAECGDTALYYASLNATVYSFEPIKSNYDDLIKNINLNPELAKKIIPINAAIGEDKILKFYQDPITPNIGASFAYNIRGKNAKISKVQGYSLETALKKFKINHVDFLKTDCKNCEYFFNEKSLENVDRIKIETITGANTDKHIEKLLSLLKKVGFDCVLYKISPYEYVSNSMSAHIFGKKQRL
jgi:FkbM family methyltransferase|tara:strand:- start:324 stop:1259 length:936 start_codon:yes stop_codon:yes gene_type:complete